MQCRYCDEQYHDHWSLMQHQKTHQKSHRPGRVIIEVHLYVFCLGIHELNSGLPYTFYRLLHQFFTPIFCAPICLAQFLHHFLHQISVFFLQNAFFQNFKNIGVKKCQEK